MTKIKCLVYYCIFISLSVFGQEADFRFHNHCLNNIIYFEDNSQLSPNDSIISWFWQFGDMAVSTDQNPIHAYTESGKHKVSLTISSLFGTAQIEKEIEIVAPPFAFFNPEQLCGGEVNFFDNTFARASSVKMWMWDFGDGNISLDQNPVHQFENKDESTINLKVMDSFGCWDSISQTVQVTGLPETGFDVKNVVLTNPAIIQIRSKNNTDSVFYLVNNKIIKSKDFVHPLSKIPITVEQKVIDHQGCTDSLTRIIHSSEEYAVSMPTIFTPYKNGDKMWFGPESEDITILEFTIKNDLGAELFKSDEIIKKWNGRNQKLEYVTRGIYFYTLIFETNQKTRVIQKGKFTVQY